MFSSHQDTGYSMLVSKEKKYMYILIHIDVLNIRIFFLHSVYNSLQIFFVHGMICGYC